MRTHLSWSVDKLRRGSEQDSPWSSRHAELLIRLFHFNSTLSSRYFVNFYCIISYAVKSNDTLSVFTEARGILLDALLSVNLGINPHPNTSSQLQRNEMPRHQHRLRNRLHPLRHQNRSAGIIHRRPRHSLYVSGKHPLGTSASATPP